MKLKKPAPAAAPVMPTGHMQAVDSKGNRRIYVDLPTPLITKMNVLAAMKGVTKRAIITMLLTDAVNRASEGTK